MGISASVGTQIPTNVVEVGTEITQPSLDAISSAPSATSVNRFVVLNDLTAKANLSGPTFTGKVNLATISVATPSINLGGPCDSTPASAANGDIWISNAANPKFTYKIGGVNYNLPVLNQFNTFTSQMVIDATSATSAVLRVTQRGTGNAIEVEDNTSPDATKFVVDQFGKVGIGVAPDATACLAIDSTGIKFGDGTVQTTAGGTAGPAGPAGANATAWVYNGAYDNGHIYSVGDFVTLDGSSYVMISYIGGAGYAPSVYTGAWQLVANKGDTGVTGNDGPQGNAGNNGNDGGTYPDAPADNTSYVRYNNNWEHTFTDFINYNASGDPFYPCEVKVLINGQYFWIGCRQV